jgi:hypothetical protein
MAKYIGWFFIVLILGSFLGIAIKTCSTANRMVDNGIETAYQQLKPSELLRKYEWFKDAHAQCDAKLANLKNYDERFHQMKVNYGADSNKRSAWSSDDRESWNIWQSEYIGLKSSYNQLAAEYNAEMVKINWAFCNKGTLPQGTTEPLPREYIPYN